MLNTAIDNTAASAIDICIHAGLPFVCYMQPHTSSPIFMAQNNITYPSEPLSAGEIDSFRGFIISTFGLGKEKQFYGITSEYTAEQIVATQPATAVINYTDTGFDTPRHRYLGDVESIIAALDSDCEKAVYARRLTINSSSKISEIAQQYFSAHPSCFRYIYYTPFTGVWIGASPELLICTHNANRTVETLALAGTRPIEESGSRWSDKNVMEHDIVVKFLTDVLTQICGNATAGERQESPFGRIEHLATPVKAYGEAPLSQLLYELSPTPALCGYPVEKAYSLITSRETFSRHCYGGAIGECSDVGAHIYVNLRSAQIIPGNPCAYHLFAGGGITRHSVPSDEWLETEHKMKSLSEILLQHKI